MLMLFLLTMLQGAAAPKPAAPPPPDPRLYVVGPNDVLTVAVYNQPQLTGKFAIEADGTLAFPLLGRVMAGGMSIRAVEDKIREGLGNGFLTDPQVTVTVEQYRSQQIFVMGEVRQPGSLQFTGAMTLIEALARAGSVTETAGAEVVIVRSPSGAAQASAPAPPPASGAAHPDTIRVNLQNLQTGTLTENLVLRPGDTIFVPRAETIFVSGQVQRPGEYPIRGRMTVRQAVALAGGLTDRGSGRRIQIIRTENGKDVQYDAEQQTVLHPGDTLIIQERYF